MIKRIKKDDTVLVNNHGVKEIGVCVKKQTKGGIVTYDVLLERGAYLSNLTTNMLSPQYIILHGIKAEITANIDPEKYEFAVENSLTPINLDDQVE